MNRYYLVEEYRFKDTTSLKYLYTSNDLKTLNDYYVFLQTCFPEKSFMMIKEVFYNVSSSNR